MGALGYLYLISEGEEGPVKIGFSGSPVSRLGTLQTGNPRPLRLVASYCFLRNDAILAETMLHEELDHWSITGEWFDLSEEFVGGYVPDFFLSEGFEPLQ